MDGLVGLNGEKKGMRDGREDARLAEKVEELGRKGLPARECSIRPVSLLKT